MLESMPMTLTNKEERQLAEKTFLEPKRVLGRTTWAPRMVPPELELELEQELELMVPVPVPELVLEPVLLV